MMFSSGIFKSANTGETIALIGTIIIGVVSIDGVYAFSLIADGIELHKFLEFGRKKIITYGTFLLSLSLALLAGTSYMEMIIVTFFLIHSLK